MNLWHLPGPGRFLQRIERALRDGANVVTRFPVAVPPGFGERTRVRLQESWRCAVFRPRSADPPFESLCRRFAPDLPCDWTPTLFDLCEHESFRGRLIWLDDLGGLGAEDWYAWKKFLADYAQACRSVPEFERTVFVAVLSGTPPADPPAEDVTLKCFDWRGVVDELDLLLRAYERLLSHDGGPAMRALLATTVARVASWDPDTAERLLDEGSDAMLEPHALLRSIADEKGWTPDTVARWELGTASGSGACHAALASLEDPPREVHRRLWSAQIAVLFPLINGWRCQFVQKHRALLEEHLRLDGKSVDPMDLDVGDLSDLVGRVDFDGEARQEARRMNTWRRRLAHLEPLTAVAARLLAGGRRA